MEKVGDYTATASEQEMLDRHLRECERCAYGLAASTRGRITAGEARQAMVSALSRKRALLAFAAAQEGTAGVVEGLLRASPEQRSRRLELEPHLSTVAVLEELLKRAVEGTDDNPRVAIDRAALAVEISLCLDENIYSEPLVHDLRDRASAILGKARLPTEARPRAAAIKRLCDAARNATFDDPKRALEIAEEALAIAVSADRSLSGADDMGRALMAVGDARRVGSDLRGAEEALTHAQDSLHSGTGDTSLWAQLDYCWGALRNAQRKFSEAIEHYDRALAAHRRIGDMHEAARDLVGKAVTVSKADPQEAIQLGRMALPLIDGEREPRLLLAAKHNLALDLADAGHRQTALQMLKDLSPYYERLGDRMILIRRRWVEGQLAQAMGDVSSAEIAYLDAIESFKSLDAHYEVAVASFDLATVYAEQGRTADIKKLAVEMISVFQALEIRRETIAALMLFRQAAEAETASLALIQHIATFVKRAQHDPAARFAPPN